MQVPQIEHGAIAPPPPPDVCLAIGVTGHREDNAVLATEGERVQATLNELFDIIAAEVAAVSRRPGVGARIPTRLHSLLADGIDQMAAEAALLRGWQLVVPLPFGKHLNVAVNAHPATPDDARALLAGTAAADPAVEARAAAIRKLYDKARCFALADADDVIAPRFLDMVDHPGVVDLAMSFSAHASARVALAGRVMIEQSDVIIGVWNGLSDAHVGGTGHTIATALDQGTPVLWIDPAAPDDWRILRSREGLRAPVDPRVDRLASLRQIMGAALTTAANTGFRGGTAALAHQPWPARSPWLFDSYRRVEAIFGGDPPWRSLRQVYATPAAHVAAARSGILAAAAAMPAADSRLVEALASQVLTRFAFADGVSAYLSDRYRGGMVVNFVLAALAVVVGIAYQPFGRVSDKWMFALVEFSLLVTILSITWAGQRRRWHGRWFETRRVAEYFRHAPALLILGVARPASRWPRGADTDWPEFYARHGLRAVGLPELTVTTAYLRAGLEVLDAHHVVQQRDYHRYKADRLTRAHHRLDKLSQRLFQLAVAAVTAYLFLVLATVVGVVADARLEGMAKIFTFLGVALPSFGGMFAGIRYFGDFERFAAISEVTAQKLDSLHLRINLLLSSPDAAFDYAEVANLAHATDEIVVSEIENWQAVFSGKHITVPV